MPSWSVNQLIQVNTHEWPALRWAFTYFFCVLGAYYIVRPVREEMGVLAGIHALPSFFVTVFLTMLAVVPLFGWAARHFPIRRLLPTVYVFFACHLVGFFTALHTGISLSMLAPVFFVWVSVFNLFVVSVFWSFMADVFSTEAARRLFGVISAGGSLGAITGPLVTATTLSHVDVSYLLLVSAGLLLAAVGCMLRLLSWFQQHHGVDLGAKRLLGGHDASPAAGLWVGLQRIAHSKYLQGICVFILCYSILSTFLYSQQTVLVPQAISNSQERMQLFATVDLVINMLTVGMQLLVTGRLFAWIGVTAMLLLMPVVSLIGFGILGWLPTLPVLIVFGVLRRAGEFSLTKPTRETLFTVVPREEKYQAKNVIDTVVHRGGDVMGTWIGSALYTLGLSVSHMSWAALPVVVIWLMTARWLGRTHVDIQCRRAPETRHNK